MAEGMASKALKSNMCLPDGGNGYGEKQSREGDRECRASIPSAGEKALLGR